MAEATPIKEEKKKRKVWSIVGKVLMFGWPVILILIMVIIILISSARSGG